MHHCNSLPTVQPSTPGYHSAGGDITVLVRPCKLALIYLTQVLSPLDTIKSSNKVEEIGTELLWRKEDYLRNLLKTKRPNPEGWARKWRSRCRLTELCDFVGLRPFLPLDDLELYRVAFLQGLESFTLDGRVMDEDISSAFLADKPVSFAVVEPLNLTLKSCHLRPP